MNGVSGAFVGHCMAIALVYFDKCQLNLMHSRGSPEYEQYSQSLAVAWAWYQCRSERGRGGGSKNDMCETLERATQSTRARVSCIADSRYLVCHSEFQTQTSTNNNSPDEERIWLLRPNNDNQAFRAEVEKRCGEGTGIQPSCRRAGETAPGGGGDTL